MSDIEYFRDTKEILIATSYTFLESHYDVNLFKIQEYEHFSNAKRLINSLIIEFNCYSKEQFEKYLLSYETLTGNLVKTDEREQLLGAIKRKENEKKIAVPFKLFFLLSEFWKFRIAFDSLKISTTSYVLDINSEFVEKYNEHVEEIAQMRAKVLFRGTLEDHIYFENAEDFAYMKTLFTVLTDKEKNDFYTINNAKLCTITSILKTRDTAKINAVLEQYGFQKLKGNVDYDFEIYEKEQHLLDYIIIFNLFFGRYYSFCFSQDYETKFIGLGQGARVCDREFVGDFITGKYYGGTVITQNIDYTELLSSEKGTIGAEILTYIEEFRKEVLSEKHSIQDSLKKANQFMAHCLENFSKVEFQLTTKNKKIDSVNVIATEKDPLKFKETEEKMPVERPESIQKRNGKKPYRIYKGKKKL